MSRGSGGRSWEGRDWGETPERWWWESPPEGQGLHWRVVVGQERVGSLSAEARFELSLPGLFPSGRFVTRSDDQAEEDGEFPDWSLCTLARSSFQTIRGGHRHGRGRCRPW